MVHDHSKGVVINFVKLTYSAFLKMLFKMEEIYVFKFPAVNVLDNVKETWQLTEKLLTFCLCYLVIWLRASIWNNIPIF